MIGFEEQLLKRNPRDNEGPETRNLEKKPLYDMLAAIYNLPPYGSRAVTREYLLKVFRGEVFCVKNNELRHFEADLTPALTKRNGDPNNGILVKKLNILLQSKGLPQLGFTHFDAPDTVSKFHQVWLFRIARFIDQSNLAELFEKEVTAEPSLTTSSSHSSHIYYGRRRASKFFFQVKGLKSNRKFWDQLKLISDQFKMLQSQRMTVEVLQQAVNDAQTKAEDTDRALGDLLSKTALSYLTYQHPEVSADKILKGAEQEHPEVKDAVNMACKL